MAAYRSKRSDLIDPLPAARLAVRLLGLGNAPRRTLLVLIYPPSLPPGPVASTVYSNLTSTVYGRQLASPHQEKSTRESKASSRKKGTPASRNRTTQGPEPRVLTRRAFSPYPSSTPRQPGLRSFEIECRLFLQRGREDNCDGRRATGEH